MAHRLLESRDFVRDALADSWRLAVPAAFGNEAFDFLGLYASLLAVGVHLHPALIVFAFVVASTLAMIPLTPGGLGFVESGLTGVLTVAGVPLEQAVLATLPITALMRKRGRIQGAWVGHRRAHEDMSRFLAEKNIHPVIDYTYSFEHALEAFAHLRRGAFGKIVIAVS